MKNKRLEKLFIWRQEIKAKLVLVKIINYMMILLCILLCNEFKMYMICIGLTFITLEIQLYRCNKKLDLVSYLLLVEGIKVCNTTEEIELATTVTKHFWDYDETRADFRKH